MSSQSVVVMAVILGVHVSTFILVTKDFVSPWIMSCFVKILGREICATLPGGTSAAWILASLVVRAIYRFAESRFLRVEAAVEERGGFKPW